MSDSTYLSCPFCGSADIDPTFWAAGTGISGPGCTQCGATGEADGWNRRTLDVERLVETLCRMTSSVNIAPIDRDLGDVFRAAWNAADTADLGFEEMMRAGFRALILAALGMEATNV
jgi:hypothetical protein